MGLKILFKNSLKIFIFQNLPWNFNFVKIKTKKNSFENFSKNFNIYRCRKYMSFRREWIAACRGGRTPPYSFPCSGNFRIINPYIILTQTRSRIFSTACRCIMIARVNTRIAIYRMYRKITQTAYFHIQQPKIWVTCHIRTCFHIVPFLCVCNT